MKTIGLLGGMSWQSTTQYYRLANELVAARLGGLHSAQCLLYSVDFAPIERMQKEDRWDDAALALASAAKSLEAGGADLLLICTNTMHKVYDQIAGAISIPVPHVVDVTASAVRAAGLSTVGLLGTAFTMEQSFYRDRLTSSGLDVVIPDDEERALVHRVIFDELCLGVIRDESRAAFVDIISHLVARGAQGVILGCTELELLLSSDDADVPLFPTTRLHIEAAVNQALAAAG
jgi:aspartate racemase